MCHSTDNNRIYCNTRRRVFSHDPLYTPVCVSVFDHSNINPRVFLYPCPSVRVSVFDNAGIQHPVMTANDWLITARELLNLDSQTTLQRCMTILILSYFSRD